MGWGVGGGGGLMVWRRKRKSGELQLHPSRSAGILWMHRTV